MKLGVSMAATNTRRNPFRSPLRLVLLVASAALPVLLLLAGLKAADSDLWSAPEVRVPVRPIVVLLPVAPEDAHRSQCAALLADQVSAELERLATAQYASNCKGDSK